jgi:hypothetical protein
MEAWVRNLVMLGVLFIWGAFMLTSMFVLKQVPSAFVWSVPGATYTVLMGRVPISWQRKSETPPTETSDRKPERQES